MAFLVSHGDDNNEILGEDVAIENVTHMPTIAGKLRRVV
jgi:hypothetical protein